MDQKRQSSRSKALLFLEDVPRLTLREDGPKVSARFVDSGFWGKDHERAEWCDGLKLRRREGRNASSPLLRESPHPFPIRGRFWRSSVLLSVFPPA